jgi:hypothetical protein
VISRAETTADETLIFFKVGRALEICEQVLGIAKEKERLHEERDQACDSKNNKIKSLVAACWHFFGLVGGDVTTHEHGRTIGKIYEM